MRTISERCIYFIYPMTIQHGSTFPGQQSFKRRANVSVNVSVLWERLYSASARSLRRTRERALRTQNGLPFTAYTCFRSINPALANKYQTIDREVSSSSNPSHFEAELILFTPLFLCFWIRHCKMLVPSIWCICPRK